MNGKALDFCVGDMCFEYRLVLAVQIGLWIIGFFLLCPSSGTLKNTKEHYASETESVSILR
jgi:hypothetical protein